MKFEFQPFEKIVIHEFSVERFDLLAKSIISTIPMGGRVEPFRWCRGYIIMVLSFPPTPELVMREVKGEIHWKYAGLCPWPKFSDVVEIEGHITIPLLDVSHQPVYSTFVSWAEANFKNDIIRAMKERTQKIVGVV